MKIRNHNELNNNINLIKNNNKIRCMLSQFLDKANHLLHNTFLLLFCDHIRWIRFLYKKKV